MKNDQSKGDQSDAPEELTPRATDINTNRQSNPSKRTKSNSRKRKQSEKWTLRDHWKRASRRQQLKWALGGIAGLIAASVGAITATYYIASYFQNQNHFIEEHRPKITFAQPPILIPISATNPPQPGRLICNVTDKAIHLSVASLRFWISNSGGDAKDVFIPKTIVAKLVPEQPTGSPEFDKPPTATDETCKERGEPFPKEMPLGGHLKAPIDVRQIVGLVPLFKTKSVTIQIIGSGDPTPPPDLKPSDWIHVAPDAKFQMYVVACVDYSDKDGARYASCATYRFVPSSHQNSLDAYGFSCPETPLWGMFQPTFGGYCEE